MIDEKLPLVELHRHLDGSIRLQTILELADQHGIALPANTLAGLAPFVHVDESEPGLMAFLERFEHMTAVLVDADACRRVAYENVEDALSEGIDYIELRYSPWFMAESHGMDPAEVMEACADGVRAAERDTGVRANIIGILSRTYGAETCLKELEAILAHRDHIVAVDLAGDELRYPAHLFKEHFKRVRDAGLQVSVHAGEADGPQSVWSAIHDLGAERIGHGFRAIEDPALVDYLARHAIGLEICPTSNLHTSTVESYASHPIKSLADRGVKFCLSTDDPGISAIDIKHEYEIAAPATGLSREQIHQSQYDGLDMAFLSADEKSELQLKAAQRTTL
ncbi:MAG: adenosine deaminase [Xanthomonadales bacterium]|nr:adenosine deaminase [Xanthomonadales bacterium]